MKIFFAAFLFFAITACNNDNNNNSDATIDDTNPAPPLLSYNVVKIYPHDTSSYTQGLIWYNNSLYEGTGNYDHSKLVRTDINTGKPMQQIKISSDAKVFGEGITIFNNKIYELTWQTNKVNVYDVNSFKKTGEFNWPYEGWGITHNDKSLIVSTGGNNLYFVNPDSFKIEKMIGVMDNYGPSANLNELEFIKGFIYANQYETDYILKINPETGRVEGKLDLTGIRQKNNIAVDENQNVLNGIAYDSAKNSLYVTGKLWPALFEIKLN